MLTGIARKIDESLPITEEEALFLHEKADLITLGALADQVRWRLHPDPVVTYIVDRNINPTNVCVTDCSFCAFYRRPGDEEAYVLPREAVYRKIDELIAVGGVLVLMQGGHHPQLKTEWYEELFRDLKRRYPQIHLHALSPPEIHHLSRLDKIPVREVIRRLKEAGMQSIPGGGAEILVDRVRRAIRGFLEKVVKLSVDGDQKEKAKKLLEKCRRRSFAELPAARLSSPALENRPAVQPL